MKKALKKGTSVILIFLMLIAVCGFSGPRDCDCFNSIFGEKSYAAYEKCTLLEVGFPILFLFIPGNRVCCRKADISDIKAKGCYEWNEKACQKNLDMNYEDE